MKKVMVAVLLLALSACGGLPVEQDGYDVKRNDDLIPPRATGGRGRNPQTILPAGAVSEEAVLQWAKAPSPLNGDFQSYAKGQDLEPDHWTFSGTWGTGAESYTTDSVSGDRSLRFKPLAGSVNFLSDKFPVIGGRAGAVTAKWKVLATGNNVLNDKLAADLLFYDKNGVQVGGIFTSTMQASNYFGATPSAWLNHNMTASVVPAGATQAAIQLTKGSSATLDILLDVVRYVETEQQPGYIFPAMVNAWVDLGAPYDFNSYMIDNNGFVHLRGIIKNGVIGLPAFTLLAGYRPSADKAFPCVSNGGFGATVINSAGVVTPAVGSNLSFALDGITFKAEQ